MALDPNEAPEGYMAVESVSCDVCAFKGECYKPEFKATPSCISVGRADETCVIFVSKPTEPTATANWPYDDRGTPVEVMQ